MTIDLERYEKEQQLILKLMNAVHKDPGCIEGFLNTAVCLLTEEELDEEIDLWSN
jgi:hypothetical protein